MRCEEAHELLSAMLDAEASADEIAGAGTHLGGCSGCREHWEGLRRDRSRIRAWPDDLPRAASASTAWRRRVPALRAAAAVILFGAGLWLGRGMREATPPATEAPTAARVAPAPAATIEETWAVYPALDEVHAAAWMRDAVPARARLGGAP